MALESYNDDGEYVGQMRRIWHSIDGEFPPSQGGVIQQWNGSKWEFVADFEHSYRFKGDEGAEVTVRKARPPVKKSF